MSVYPKTLGVQELLTPEHWMMPFWWNGHGDYIEMRKMTFVANSFGLNTWGISLFCFAKGLGGSISGKASPKSNICLIGGAIFTVNCGDKVRFWEDTWILNTPLKTAFPALYRICSNKSCLVKDCYKEEGWSVLFRRSFGHVEVQQWEELLGVLEEKQLTNEKDTVSWALEKSGHYTTRSLYKFFIT